MYLSFGRVNANTHLSHRQDNLSRTSGHCDFAHCLISLWITSLYIRHSPLKSPSPGGADGCAQASLYSLTYDSILHMSFHQAVQPYCNFGRWKWEAAENWTHDRKARIRKFCIKFLVPGFGDFLWSWAGLQANWTSAFGIHTAGGPCPLWLAWNYVWCSVGHRKRF